MNSRKRYVIRNAKTGKYLNSYVLKFSTLDASTTIVWNSMKRAKEDLAWYRSHGYLGARLEIEIVPVQLLRV